MMCKHCMSLVGVLFLVFGILFLLRDLNVWNFWGINWWTVVFIVMGAVSLGSSGCKECQAVRKGK